MTQGPRVFVPNDVHIEYTNLHKWGTVCTIFKAHLYPDTVDQIGQFSKTAAVVLKDFRPEVDMLALIGDPALGALAIMTLVSLDKARVTVLKWDKHLGAYYPATLETQHGQDSRKISRN